MAKSFLFLDAYKMAKILNIALNLTGADHKLLQDTCWNSYIEISIDPPVHHDSQCEILPDFSYPLQCFPSHQHAKSAL